MAYIEKSDRYIISDCHFAHKNISQFRKLLSNWKETSLGTEKPRYMSSEEQHEALRSKLCK